MKNLTHYYRHFQKSESENRLVFIGAEATAAGTALIREAARPFEAMRPEEAAKKPETLPLQGHHFSTQKERALGLLKEVDKAIDRKPGQPHPNADKLRAELEGKIHAGFDALHADYESEMGRIIDTVRGGETSKEGKETIARFTEKAAKLIQALEARVHPERVRGDISHAELWEKLDAAEARRDQGEILRLKTELVTAQLKVLAVPERVRGLAPFMAKVLHERGASLPRGDSAATREWFNAELKDTDLIKATANELVRQSPRAKVPPDSEVVGQFTQWIEAGGRSLYRFFGKPNVPTVAEALALRFYRIGGEATALGAPLYLDLSNNKVYTENELRSDLPKLLRPFTADTVAKIRDENEGKAEDIENGLNKVAKVEGRILGPIDPVDHIDELLENNPDLASAIGRTRTIQEAIAKADAEKTAAAHEAAKAAPVPAVAPAAVPAAPAATEAPPQVAQAPDQIKPDLADIAKTEKPGNAREKMALSAIEEAAQGNPTFSMVPQVVADYQKEKPAGVTLLAYVDQKLSGGDAALKNSYEFLAEMEPASTAPAAAAAAPVAAPTASPEAPVQNAEQLAKAGLEKLEKSDIAQGLKGLINEWIVANGGKAIEGATIQTMLKKVIEIDTANIQKMVKNGEIDLQKAPGIRQRLNGEIDQWELMGGAFDPIFSHAFAGESITVAFTPEKISDPKIREAYRILTRWKEIIGETLARFLPAAAPPAAPGTAAEAAQAAPAPGAERPPGAPPEVSPLRSAAKVEELGKTIQPTREGVRDKVAAGLAADAGVRAAIDAVFPDLKGKPSAEVAGDSRVKEAVTYVIRRLPDARVKTINEGKPFNNLTPDELKIVNEGIKQAVARNIGEKDPAEIAILKGWKMPDGKPLGEVFGEPFFEQLSRGREIAEKDGKIIVDGKPLESLTDLAQFLPEAMQTNFRSSLDSTKDEASRTAARATLENWAKGDIEGRQKEIEKMVAEIDKAFKDPKNAEKLFGGMGFMQIIQALMSLWGALNTKPPDLELIGDVFKDVTDKPPRRPWKSMKASREAYKETLDAKKPDIGVLLRAHIDPRGQEANDLFGQEKESPASRYRTEARPMIKEYLAGQFGMNSITAIDGSAGGIMTMRGLRGNQSVEIDFYTQDGKLQADVYKLVPTQRPEDPEKPNGPKITEMKRPMEPNKQFAEVTADKIRGALGAAAAAKPASGEAPAKAEKPAEPPPLKTVEERAAYEASQVPDFKKRIQEIQSEYAKLDPVQKTTKTEWLYVHEQLLADPNLKERYAMAVETERNIIAKALDGARDQIAKIRLTKGLEWKAVEMAKIKKVTPEQIANQRLLQIKNPQGETVAAVTIQYTNEKIDYRLSKPGEKPEHYEFGNVDDLQKAIQEKIKAPAATAVATAK